MKAIFRSVLFVSILACGAWAVECAERYGEGQVELVLATGSPGELGLVKALAEEFSKTHNASLCWVKAGSGKSLSLLKNKEVDVIMVHAPEAEKQAVLEGWASNRTLIGSNEFYIAGPKNDPAGIAKAKSAHEAYALIAKAKALFYTRADNSGTHKKELDIWKKASVEPQGDWYVPNKDFMLATLKKADTTGGYFMTDSSTWVVAKKELSNLAVLFRGDVMLVNTYNALKQAGLETDKKVLSKAFVDFVGGPEGQRIIGTFGTQMYGEPIYNDAVYVKPYDR